MNFRIKYILLFFAFATFEANAQSRMQATLPALTFAPDARSSAMGDAGVATSTDVFSQHYNAAKYVFSENHGGIGLSYTPWLRNATSDIDITYLSGFYKIDAMQSLSASLRFFSLGNIDLYNANANLLQTVKPNEFAIDLAYARRLSQYFSGAVTFRYINSSKISIQNSNPMVDHTSNVAADVAFYYRKPVRFGFAENSELAFGAGISNLGTKVETSDSISYFLPMQFRLGARITFNFDEANALSPTLELSKSLVPSSYSDINSSAFAAAAKGFTSNYSNIVWAVGAEYSYKKQFFVQAGYHHEAKKDNGNSYITFGAGAKYKNLGFGASYLFVTNGDVSILDNTYRLTLYYNFGGASKTNYYDYDL